MSALWVEMIDRMSDLELGLNRRMSDLDMSMTDRVARLEGVVLGAQESENGTVGAGGD